MKKTVIITAALAACCLAGLAATAAADVYRYVDERGVVVFSDTPRHEGYKVHLRERSEGPRMTGIPGYYPYRQVVEEASRMYGVDNALVRAVVETESDYNRFAISSAGARGLMQLMPATMNRLSVRNPWDPEQNVQAGTRYLKGLLERFSGDTRLALAAYNAGPNAVLRYGAIPPYPETQRYVRKVMRLYVAYSTTVGRR
jgi:soluble lytic murein transglycosylase